MLFKKSLDFDIIIAPVHLDPGYPMLAGAADHDIPVLSHHQAVRQIFYQKKKK